MLRVSISKQATLKTDFGTKLPAVLANPAQIRQVVMNLVTNASEAIGNRTGIIHITTAQVKVGSDAPLTGASSLAAGDYLKLEVFDSGSGMTPEVQTRIFDLYFTTRTSGRGLGLANVQEIVRGHNGAINVVSSLGQGTRIEVLLPCTNHPVEHSRAIEMPPAANEQESITGTVLVVEDEETLRRAISKMLRMKGFSVIEAIDGGAAVDLFRANEREIGVVLLDMTLPVMDGGEVFVELRRIRPDVRVILTTAYREETTLTTLGGQQPWTFIRKPYRLNDLLNLLRNRCPAKEEMHGHPES